MKRSAALENNSRDHGLDIVRIASMISIVILHIIGAGGVLTSCYDQGYTTKYWLVFWLQILAYTSVDVFGLLSGFLGVFKRRSSSFRIIELVCIVIFYSTCITAVFGIVFPQTIVDAKVLLRSIFPIITSNYWYITCYIPIGLLQPYINKMLLGISENQHKRLVILIMLFFGFLQSAAIYDLFAFKEGYSFIWLLCLYIVGAYIRRVDLLKHVAGIRYKSFLVVVVGSLVLLGGNIVVSSIIHKQMHYFVSYISPIIMIMSMCIIFIFRDVKLDENRYSNIIVAISLVTFDVYMIHCHKLIFDNYIRDCFIWIAESSIFMILVYICSLALCIFAFAAGIGLLRYFIFRVFRIDSLIMKLSAKLDPFLYGNNEESLFP